MLPFPDNLLQSNVNVYSAEFNEIKIFKIFNGFYYFVNDKSITKPEG